MKVREVDFVERLNFFLEAIYQDAKVRNNVVIFDYDPAYPRRYEIAAGSTIKTLENLAKIFINHQEGARVLIAFRLANYSISSVYFEISVSSNLPLMQPDLQLLALAREYATKAGGFISAGKEGEFKFSVKAPLPGTQAGANSLNLASETIKKYNVVIAYEDKIAFDILAKQLRFAGLSVRPSRDIQSLLRHVSDAIYRPDVVFVFKDFLDDEQVRERLFEAAVIRRFAVCVICENDENLTPNLAKKPITLRQPYVYDALRAVLDMCYMQNIGDQRE